MAFDHFKSITPVTLAGFTNPTLIISALIGREAEPVIQELRRALEHAERVRDGAVVCQSALSRERIASTNMEAGLAFPHARLKDLKSLCFALGRAAEPLI